MSSCIFCAILNSEAPGSFVARGDDVSAFMDIMPANPGHLLVVPNDHYANLEELPPRVAEAAMALAQQAAIALRKSSVPTDGVNLFLADGAAAGQEVFHAHLHVIPRSTGDGFVINPNYDRPPSRDLLDTQAAELRTLL